MTTLLSQFDMRYSSSLLGDLMEAWEHPKVESECLFLKKSYTSEILELELTCMSPDS